MRTSSISANKQEQQPVNLSIQIDKLSKAGYIEVEKTYKGKVPCTLCKITPLGIQAFEEYVEALRSYVKL